MRLIDADALIAKINERLYDEGNPFPAEITEALDMIENAPTVEYPLKGKWIYDPLHNPVCSVCGGVRRDNRFDHVSYCNKCGAEMRGDV